MVDRTDQRTTRQLATIYEALRGDPIHPGAEQYPIVGQSGYFSEEEAYCGQQ